MDFTISVNFVIPVTWEHRTSPRSGSQSRWWSRRSGKSGCTRGASACCSSTTARCPRAVWCTSPTLRDTTTLPRVARRPLPCPTCSTTGPRLSSSRTYLTWRSWRCETLFHFFFCVGLWIWKLSIIPSLSSLWQFQTPFWLLNCAFHFWDESKWCKWVTVVISVNHRNNLQMNSSNWIILDRSTWVVTSKYLMA